MLTMKKITFLLAFILMAMGQTLAGNALDLKEITKGAFRGVGRRQADRTLLVP